MMHSDATLTIFDRVLCLQLIVAWAGETAEEPKRLGWWKSDLIDEMGGGDFFRRLVPRTQKWAALEATRELAKAADERVRRELPNPDQLRTLYFWGFEMDERLNERLRQHKLSYANPQEALKLPFELGSAWMQPDFEAYLAGLSQETSYVTKRQGRELSTPKTDNPAEAAALLAAALLPLGDSYPAPYFRIKASRPS